GVRFGCALGMEVHFPELFLEYERLDVDVVLFSTAGPPEPGAGTVFAAEALAHATTNRYWVSYADSTDGADPGAVEAPSGVVSPDGRWVARCPHDGVPAVVVADLAGRAEDLARPWRRRVRTGIYDPHLVRDDPRSSQRATF